MSGNLLSQMRTGAVPGVASKYLARSGAETLGIIGAGMVGKTALLGISAAVKTLKRVYIYDVFESASEKFLQYAEKEIGIEGVIVHTMEDAVKDMDIVHIAASGEKLPAINTNHLKKGALLCLTGAAEFINEDWINDCSIYADNWKLHQAFIHEMDYPREGIRDEILSWAPSAPVIDAVYKGKLSGDTIKSVGDVIIGNAPARVNPDDKIIFITSGMAVEDVAWGKKILERANKENIGQILTFWDKQYWLK